MAPSCCRPQDRLRHAGAGVGLAAQRSFTGPNSKPLPATAQVAHQQANCLISPLGRAKSSQAETPFRYRARGSLVSFGGATAAGRFPTPSKGSPLVLHGVLPKVAYASLQFMHRAALSGWPQAFAYALADRLRRVSAPAVKLHW